MNLRTQIIEAAERAYPGYLDSGAVKEITSAPYLDVIATMQELIDENVCSFDPEQGIRLAVGAQK